MSSYSSEKYINAVVICHGKSELQITRFIISNLHLRMKPFSKDNGKHSIQINGLPGIFNTKVFKNMSNFLNEFPVKTSGKGKNKKLNDFKLFIIMDTDDCSESEKMNYISKEMLKDHWLYEYTVPIYNSPSLEDVLTQTGIMSKKIRDKDKGTYYSKVFPINTNPLSNDTLLQVKTFEDALRKSKKTNMFEFIQYCISKLEKF